MKIIFTLLTLFLISESVNGQYIPTDQNPKYTYSINPKYTYSLNPNYTPGLNPFKESWTGKYLFNENGNLIGLLSKANNDFYLLFNTDGEWLGYFVRAGANFNLFSLNGEWTGQYLCSDSGNGYNLFDESGEWTTNYVK